MMETPWRIFALFLRLGCISFGGPMAHVVLMRQEFTQKRAWLSTARFDELFALCQFLPGPSSSQLGMALGLGRAGWRGMLAAWLGFTLPSALVLGLAGLVGTQGIAGAQGWIHGLKIFALAVLLHATLAMARSLCPDRARLSLAVAVMVGTFVWPSTMGMLGLLALAAVWGWFAAVKVEGEQAKPPVHLPVGASLGVLAVLGVLLFGVPWLAGVVRDPLLEVFAGFSRTGTLVFGGGHVVLPLLHAEVVDKGWVTKEAFLAGYGLVQGMPGPMFSFAAFLGAAKAGIPGALVATVGIFLPGAILLVGILPWWERLRHEPRAQGVIAAVGAASVGLLLHVLLDPGWRLAIGQARDYCLLVVALLLLGPWKRSAWQVGLGCAACGWLLGLHS